MTNTGLIVKGLWIEVIGQILTSIGYTREVHEPSEDNLRVVAIGDATQAVGNSLQAVGEDDPIGSAGDWIEASGAAASSFATFRQLEEDDIEYLRLEILGASLQALGPAVSALVEEKQIIVFALYLQTIGAFIEAIGGIKELKGFEKIGVKLSAIGNYLQTIGVIIQALVLTKELFELEGQFERTSYGY